MECEATEELPLVSICIPVKNGEGRLEHCLESIRRLDYPQERIEILVADGLSTDRTPQIAESFGAKVLPNPKQIVASGRNHAFAAARGAFIASTDDDCVVPPLWLRAALSGFRSADIAAVGGPSRLPDDSRALATAANFVFRQASRAGYSMQSDHVVAGPAEDLPGCNVLYRSEVVHDVGSFDENLVTAEDVDFHTRIRERDKVLILSPEAYVWHHKRATVTGLFRQLRRFAAGRVQLARKRPGARRPLHFLLGWAWVYALAAVIALLAVAPLWISFVSFFAVWTLLSGLALLDGENVTAALLVPFALVTMVLGWSTGHIEETLFPMTSTAGR